MRDVRIAQIYEGTNGIQALDLMGRKTVRSGGQLFKVFAGDVNAFVAEHEGNSALAEFLEPVKLAHGASDRRD